MILYLDTSALVKLYVREAYSLSVRAWVDTATVVATAEVAYVEVLSALARRLRDGTLDEPAYEGAVAAVERDWAQLLVLGLERLRAGQLVGRHRLRAFDAVHVAAAMSLADRVAPEPVRFASFDLGQQEAARREGLDNLLP